MIMDKKALDFVLDAIKALKNDQKSLPEKL